MEAAASAATKQYGHGALKDLQLEVIMGIATCMDVFAVLPSYNTCHTSQNRYDSSSQTLLEDCRHLESASSSFNSFKEDTTRLRGSRTCTKINSWGPLSAPQAMHKPAAIKKIRQSNCAVLYIVDHTSL